jgi:hypothetical protein
MQRALASRDTAAAAATAAAATPRGAAPALPPPPPPGGGVVAPSAGGGDGVVLGSTRGRRAMAAEVERLGRYLVQRGPWHSVWQMPHHFVPGLRAQPWHTPASFPQCVGDALACAAGGRPFFIKM